MTISENVFRILKEKRISQKEFSEMTGISQSTICDWKHKGKTPNSDKIAIICNALDITPYDLIDDIKKPQDMSDMSNEENTYDNAMIIEMIKQTNDKVDRMMAYMVALSGLTDNRNE